MKYAGESNCPALPCTALPSCSRAETSDLSPPFISSLKSPLMLLYLCPPLPFSPILYPPSRLSSLKPSFPRRYYPALSSPLLSSLLLAYPVLSCIIRRGKGNWNRKGNTTEKRIANSEEHLLACLPACLLPFPHFPFPFPPFPP